MIWFLDITPRSEHPNAKIGTDDSKDSLEKMAKAYKQLSNDERSQLKGEAGRINAARVMLMARPLSAKAGTEANDVGLRSSQVQRLNQPRLDISLHSVTGHKVWNHGLGLSDHVCALKPSFVRQYCQRTQDFNHMSDFAKKLLRYDSKIQKNPDNMPTFFRSCLWTNCGVCEQDPLFSTVKTLVGQFDLVFSSYKLGVSPFIVKFAFPRGHRLSVDPVWIIIGAVTSKPISFTGIHLTVQQGLKLIIKTHSNVPCAGSLHQLFRDLLHKYRANSGSPEDFSLQVR